MNAGFSNLDTLKKELLGNGLAGQKEFDSMILMLGLGVAAQFEQYCKRKFALQQTSQSFSADRIHFVLSNTPLVSVDKTEFKKDEATGFVEQDASFIRSIDFEAGIIYLPDGSDAGEYWSIVRFTSTGGFWWEMLEPDNEEYPSTITNDATVLPDDLKHAWLLQCQFVWSKRDKLGLSITDKPEQQSSLADLKLLPLVESTLKSYVKMNLV